MKYEEKTLTRDSKFKGNIFEVAVDEVLLPDGKTSRRELIFHRGAVAVLAVTLEGKLVIVKQYRKAIEDVSYEIPAGKLEVGVENPRPLDDDEFLEIFELTYDECMELVKSGEIKDAKTILALQYYALHFGGK